MAERKTRRVEEAVWGFLSVAWLTCIYAFSAQPAHESSTVSASIAVKIVRSVFPSFEALPVHEQKAALFAIETVVRKCAHMAEFALLALFICLFIYYYIQRLRLSTALIFTGLFAASDEFHQIFVQGRGPAVFDVMVDISGAVLGLTALWVIMRLIVRRYDRGGKT